MQRSASSLYLIGNADIRHLLERDVALKSCCWTIMSRLSQIPRCLSATVVLYHTETALSRLATLLEADSIKSHSVRVMDEYPKTCTKERHSKKRMI